MGDGRCLLCDVGEATSVQPQFEGRLTKLGNRGRVASEANERVLKAVNAGRPREDGASSNQLQALTFIEQDVSGHQAVSFLLRWLKIHREHIRVVDEAIED